MSYDYDEISLVASAPSQVSRSTLATETYMPESSCIWAILDARGVSSQVSHTLSVSVRSPRKSGIS